MNNTRRVLPFVSQWTLQVTDKRGYSVNEDKTIAIIRSFKRYHPSSKSLPVPLFNNNDGDNSHLQRFANLSSPPNWNAVNAMYFASHNLSRYYSRVVSEYVNTFDCGAQLYGPALAIRRKRRLPNLSLFTLLVIGNRMQEILPREYSFSINWHRSSMSPSVIYPPRAILRHENENLSLIGCLQTLFCRSIYSIGTKYRTDNQMDDLVPTANDSQVMIATLWYNGGTLERLLPFLKLMKLKQPLPNDQHNKSLVFHDSEWAKDYLTTLYHLIDQLLYQVSRFNARKLLHRDIRLSNLIMNSQIYDAPTLNLIDYGFAIRECESFDETERSADPYFYCVHPPEVVSGTARYGYASEVWSVGMIILSLWTCDKPFCEMTDAEIRSMILSPTLMDSLIPSDCPLLLSSFIRQCCHYDHTQRFKDVDAARKWWDLSAKVL